jgi:Tol biopolymer transport system component
MIVSGCSIEISQQPVTTPTSQPVIFTPTVLPNSANLPALTPSSQISVTWANLGLTGKLVYIGSVVEGNNYVLRIQMLDLVTGGIVTIFKAPVNSWIYYLSVSPDDQQLTMSYSPPHQENPDVYQALYTMPLDGSRPPELLFMPPTKEDQYNQVEWSPDGEYIYYTYVNYHNNPDPNRINPFYEIFRLHYPEGQPEKVADQAYWPRLSPDSSRLVYVAVDPFAFKNSLVVSDANGSNAQRVVLSGAWDPDIKDAPIFSPDGQSIIFSAAARTQSLQPGWIEELMGISIVKADGTIPSEWWSVPIIGGIPIQLTHIQSTGLYASYSPDREYIASSSGSGIFVMKTDGSDLTLLLPNEISSGTVTWIP